MIKLLKIACLLAVIAAGAAVILAGLGIYRGTELSRKRQDFLDKETIINKLEKLGNLPDIKKDTTSPLVSQAKLLALRIDPPAPKQKPEPKNNTTAKTKKEIRKPVIQAPVINSPPVNAKFKLVATCRYEKYPAKSLALLDITSQGHQWVRQGELVGQHTIHEIRDGSIVVYQNGRQSGIYQVPRENSIKSLMKGGDSAAAVTASIPGVNNIPRAATTGRAVPSNPQHQPASIRPVRNRANSRTATGSLSRFSSKSRPVPRQKSERSNEETISEIQKIISETNSGDATDEQKKGETEMLTILMELLEKEQKEAGNQAKTSKDKEKKNPSLPEKK